MSGPGDALAADIRHYVSGRVREDMVDIVSEVAARIVLELMSNPYFTDRLRVVQQLRDENMLLRQALAQHQASTVRARKPAAKKRGAPRKKVGGTATKNQKSAFREGFNDLR